MYPINERMRDILQSGLPTTNDKRERLEVFEFRLYRLYPINFSIARARETTNRGINGRLGRSYGGRLGKRREG